MPIPIRLTRSNLVAYCAALALASAPAAFAAESAKPSGFYGGVSVRDAGSEQGLTFGALAPSFAFATPLEAEPAARTSAFGGYRFRRDFALEASVASSTAYRLTGRGGVGLVRPGDTQDGARQWNVDVVGAWSFWRSLSLYGRLGYAQSELAPAMRTSLAGPERRTDDGLQYGVGLRYDFTRALGLKLEYARVGHQTGDYERGLFPDADRVQFGVQFRF
ncbi:MAG: porin family protein [Betaproteobacteria bacterium]|nr:porin family protein [Betaproteobacteria bacterium]